LKNPADPESFHLAEHGDSRQRQWAGRILPAWPHYEHFWRHYVVPLTFQALEPGNYFVRPRIHKVFRHLADTQYAAWFHVALMHQWADYVASYRPGDTGHPWRPTEALYTFFSHALSLVDATHNFGGAVDVVAERYGGRPPFAAVPDDRHPGTYRAFGPDWGFVKDRELWKFAIDDNVSEYRNWLVHRHPVFLQNNAIPRRGRVESWAGLCAISSLALDDTAFEREFEPVVPRLRSVLEDFTMALDCVWRVAFEALNEAPERERMLGAMGNVKDGERGLTLGRILGVREKGL